MVTERNLRAMTEGPLEMDPKSDTPRVLEGGRTVEHGSYDNLMVQSRHYRQFHELKPGRHEAGKLT